MAKAIKQSLPAGTRVEVRGFPAMGGCPAVAPEAGTVQRWTRINGPIPNHCSPTNGGWHVIKFDGGGMLIIHESGFRVTDNRGDHDRERM